MKAALDCLKPHGKARRRLALEPSLATRVREALASAEYRSYLLRMDGTFYRASALPSCSPSARSDQFHALLPSSRVNYSQKVSKTGSEPRMVTARREPAPKKD
jgi:hypothetical protein